MKKFIVIIFILIVALPLLNSCKKKYDLPPKNAGLANSGSITIDSIIKKFQAYYLSGNPTSYFKFSDNINVTCTVTADEVSGNIYKTVFVQDATGAMEIKLINAGGLYVGDLIRINLNGIVLDDYAKMIQLDSVDIEKSVVKISSGHIVTPTKVTMDQLSSLTTFSLSTFQSRLVLLDSVEFDVFSKDKFYSDQVYKTNIERTVINSAGNKLIVRTSGYCNFAGSRTPCGKGQLTAIVSQYNNTIQLTIRDVAEVKLTGGICPYLAKNYEDQNIFGGWTPYTVSGNNNWTVGTNGGNYANISNYPSNGAGESWLISPPMNLSGAINPVFSFKSAYNYGPASPLQLSVHGSTNYVSGSPASATWTALNPVLSPGGWAWSSSGNISLSAYKLPNVHVAFKYLTAAVSGSTWEVDDITVVEN